MWLTKKLHRWHLLFLKFQLSSGFYDVVIADELNVAVAFGLVSEEEVVELIKSKPPKVELVITGRYATENINPWLTTSPFLKR